MKKKIPPYKTILVLVIGFSLLGMWLKSSELSYFALGIGVVALLSERLATLIERGWFRLGTLLGFIMPNIILTIIYALFLVPISLFYRFFGRRKSYHIDRKEGSQFVSRNENFTRETMENPW